MGIIIISRGSYSYGTEIAQKVAKTLNYDIISREKIIEASAKEFNVPEVKLLHAIDDAPSFLERITHGRKKYVAYIKSELLNFLKKDNVVYHGFAGIFFVRDIPHILKVRITADMEKRIKFVMERDKVSEKEALNIIKKLDKERSKWSRYLYGIDIADPYLYDLVVHIGDHSLNVDEAVSIICHTALLDTFKTSSETLKIIEDRATAARQQSVL